MNSSFEKYKKQTLGEGQSNKKFDKNYKQTVYLTYDELTPVPKAQIEIKTVLKNLKTEDWELQF